LIGFRVAQLRLIFRKARAPKEERALTYVQWFTNPTDSQQDDTSQLFKVERRFNAIGQRMGEVIDMANVVQSCPLTPRYGKKADDLVPNIGIDGDNSLEECNKFWVNCFHDQLAYQTLW
jgi:hypothetical protein